MRVMWEIIWQKLLVLWNLQNKVTSVGYNINN